MASSQPGWISIVTPPTGGGVRRMPRPARSTLPGEASAVQSKALRSQTAAQSHNVFRPDIFRVSEGYLN